MLLSMPITQLRAVQDFAGHLINVKQAEQDALQHLENEVQKRQKKMQPNRGEMQAASDEGPAAPETPDGQDEDEGSDQTLELRGD